MKPQPNDPSYSISRRQLLIDMASLPIAYALESGTRQWSTPQRQEEFLPCCAASITACWHLLRGSDFAIAEEILSKYLPHLTLLAQHFSPYQKIAASLATQGYRIKGILALHRNDPITREAYFQQAVGLGEISEQLNFHAAALISLAYHKQDPVEATTLYEQALGLGKEHSPLLRSRLYAELSVVYAQQNCKEKALRLLKQSQEAYPDEPQKDPCYLYADFSPSSRIMENGRTYLALDQHYPGQHYAKDAEVMFGQIEDLQQKSVVPARIQVEITNYLALTALANRELQEFCRLLELGVHGAYELRSEKRKQEALTAYCRARQIWPDEKQLARLDEMFTLSLS